MTYPNVGILGTGSYVPERIVSNHVPARSLGIDDDWIFVKTGIRERRFASPDEATSDMAVRAAERALASANVPASALDLVVVATSSPDCPQPATACAVQAMLRANRAAAFLGPERVHSTIERYGNTGGASIPVTLDDAVQKGRVRPDDCVVLVGFGGGLSWGSVVLRWAGTPGVAAISA